MLAVWDCTGFEYIEDITEMNPDAWEKQNLLRVLKNEELTSNPLNGMLNYWIMRARFNSQRHYEIYAFELGDDLDCDDVKQWTSDDPQAAADWIRANGQPVYSDRKTVKDTIV